MQIALDYPIPLPNGLTCYLANRKMQRGTRYIVWEVFSQNRYYYPGFKLNPGDTVLDVGGNCGLFVLWAAPQVRDGRIVTVEPDPGVLRCLHTNIEANRLTNVTVVEAAAGIPDSTLDIESYVDGEGLTHNAAYRPPLFVRAVMTLGRYQRRVTTVPQRSLGQIMEEQGLDHVDFLKLDCEGGEYNILRNMSRDELARIDKMALEYHEFSGDHHHEDLMAILRDAGFTVEHKTRFFERMLGRTGAIWAKREQ